MMTYRAPRTYARSMAVVRVGGSPLNDAFVKCSNDANARATLLTLGGVAGGILTAWVTGGSTLALLGSGLLGGGLGMGAGQLLQPDCYEEAKKATA